MIITRSLQDADPCSWRWLYALFGGSTGSPSSDAQDVSLDPVISTDRAPLDDEWDLALHD
jgi:hypothetical protein